jgi:hypothetical protein
VLVANPNADSAVAPPPEVPAEVLYPPPPPPPVGLLLGALPPPPPPATTRKSAAKRGVAELDVEVYSLFPVALVPRTVNVYEVPEVSPDTVIGLDKLEPVIEPGFDSAVNVVAAPPAVDAVNATLADNAPPVAVPIVGTVGMSTTLPFLGDTLLVAIDYAAIP